MSFLNCRFSVDGRLSCWGGSSLFLVYWVVCLFFNDMGIEFCEVYLLQSINMIWFFFFGLLMWWLIFESSCDKFHLVVIYNYFYTLFGFKLFIFCWGFLCVYSWKILMFSFSIMSLFGLGIKVMQSRMSWEVFSLIFSSGRECRELV